MEAGDDAVLLVDGVHRGGGGLDADLHRVDQVVARDPQDLRGHGGGEERHLAVRRRVLEDPVDVLGEAHVEHLVGLVEDQRLQPVERQGIAAHVVHDPAGGADDHLGHPLELAHLEPVALAAVDGQHVELLEIMGVALECLGHLQRQLPGWGQHQDLRLSGGKIDARQERQRKSGRLAGPRLGLAQQVAALEKMRDAPALDRGGSLVAQVGNGLGDSGGQA